MGVGLRVWSIVGLSIAACAWIKLYPAVRHTKNLVSMNVVILLQHTISLLHG